MELGTKIKQLRLHCALTQEELADRCELTKGYISQLENDLTSPSIATLVDILSALGTNLKEFFSEEEEEKIVFKEDDFIEKDTGAVKINWLVNNAQKNAMEPILMEIGPGGESTPLPPSEGEEFGYVLCGSVQLCVGGKKTRVKAGGSFCLHPKETHYLANPGKTRAKVLWVATPPSF